MHVRWMQAAFLLSGLTALGGLQAFAQTDVAASLYGAFGGSTSANGTAQSPANAAGGIIEVRHIRNPLMGYEGTYSYNRANQVYAYHVTVPACTIPPCEVPSSEAISANAHELTGDWLVSAKMGSLRPFVLAGGGILFNQPTGGQITYTVFGTNSITTSTAGVSGNTSTKPVFVYGGGVDWTVLPHIGMRFQYRGNLAHVPDAGSGIPFTSTGALAHTAEPMIGAFFRF